MGRSVQIDRQLFIDLVLYVLKQDDSSPEYKYLLDRLQQKADKMTAHDAFTRRMKDDKRCNR